MRELLAHAATLGVSVHVAHLPHRGFYGVWAGFNRYEYTTTLCDALLEAFPGARAYEHVGARRRGGIHSTGDFTH